MEGGDMTSIKLIGILISCSFITIITGKYNAKNYFRLKKKEKKEVKIIFNYICISGL
jgi:hypothetical protein